MDFLCSKSNHPAANERDATALSDGALVSSGGLTVAKSTCGCNLFYSKRLLNHARGAIVGGRVLVRDDADASYTDSGDQPAGS